VDTIAKCGSYRIFIFVTVSFIVNIYKIYYKHISHTSLGTGLPSSGSLSDERNQAQRANQGMHRNHWDD